MRWWVELRKNLMAQVAGVCVICVVFMALMAPVFGFDKRADEGDLGPKSQMALAYNKL